MPWDSPLDRRRYPDTSDGGLARAFAERHAGDLRYVAAWGRWLRWDGTRWAEDRTGHAFDRLHAVVAELEILFVTNGRKMRAALKVAETDHRLAADPDRWDRSPDLLNDGGGDGEGDGGEGGAGP